MKRILHILVSVMSIEVMIMTPLLGAIQVQAATSTSPTTGCNAQQIATGTQDPGIAPQDAQAAANDSADPGDLVTASTNNLTQVDVATAKQDPFFDESAF